MFLLVVTTNHAQYDFRLEKKELRRKKNEMNDINRIIKMIDNAILNLYSNHKNK